ncbi:plectrovirus-related protein [Spiroplasma poulsonii]|uniref:Uncharacterized protein n=1 Tax=Spiroplasma poulsonii TaxID=2138 RepID=A0A2P6FCB3_9MOLU|nr:plectrovirus-related protein [Spiroplasma poulsonii]PQM31091.1 hypothetical protein SMSRO_SF008900 [Spiroplasma poulsonii]PWF96090.1 hypothetical protein SMSE_15280 [Spiroplasma poulsonii]PWF98864.1 hypothetical protein SMH99_14270 [Spiroplasma poulsonii]
MCEMELIASLKGTKHNFMFNNKDGYLMGVSIDSDWHNRLLAIPFLLKYYYKI